MTQTNRLFAACIFTALLSISVCSKESDIVPNYARTIVAPANTQQTTKEIWDVVLIVTYQGTVDTVALDSTTDIVPLLSGSLTNPNKQIGHCFRFPIVKVCAAYTTENQNVNSVTGNVLSGPYKGKSFVMHNIHTTNESLITTTSATTLSICGGPQKVTDVYFICKKRTTHVTQ